MDRDRTPHPTPSDEIRKGSTSARRRTSLLAALALVLAACSSSVPGAGGPGSVAPNPTVAPNSTIAPFPTITAFPTASVVAYPMKLTDDEGTAVMIPARPRHIISLSPAFTETAFALGAGDRVVGGTDADDYPAEAAALPDVVSQTKILMEKVVALQPDLVLAAGNGFTPPGDIKRMRDLGFPVVVVYAQSVDEVLSDIELIGQAVDTPTEAALTVADMKARFDAISLAAAATIGRPRTFYEIGYGPDIYAPAPGFFVTDLVQLAGGDPITTGDPNVFSIPLEKLLTADPQVIVVGDALYGVCPTDVLARAGWGGMTAVKSGAVRPVNDIVVTRPGPRLPEGLASLTRAIHPELALADEPADPPLCTGLAASPAPSASAAP